jgi:hypothetical protein
MKTVGSFDLKFWILVIAGTASGILIAVLDSSPGWDDTGITAGLILICSAVCGFISRSKLWLWALITGIWIPVHGILTMGDFKFLLILLISFAGSYGGGLFGRMLKK